MPSLKLRPAAHAAGLTILLGTNACTKSELPAANSATAVSVAPAAATPSATATPAKANTTAVPEAVRKLFGKWVRADGGYVLELKSADISGVIDAGYFNPKSIRVSRAIWMQGGAGLQVMVELNDVGYPGATYVLSHDVQNDQLVGKYTQPQMQQTFDVEFVRQPTP